MSSTVSAKDSSRQRTRPEHWLARRGGWVEALRLPAFLMGLITSGRNRLYDSGCLPIRRLPLPIVSVGNLTVGGTGKTPMVIWLLRELQARGYRPGVLSRGYRAPAQGAGERGLNDEGRLLERACPGVCQVQMPDRVAGALRLEQQGVDVIVLDDGFQHRRLGRDLDLVLIDACRPWGLPASGTGDEGLRALLPRGFLRERVAGLGRASAVVISRSDALDGPQLEALEQALHSEAPGVVRLLGEHRPTSLRRGTQELELGALRGLSVQLVSGIGNPEAFERTAREAGARIESVHVFADHHPFSRQDLAGLATRGELLVTSKDSSKLDQLGVAHLVLEVSFAVTRGAPVLGALLDALPRSQAALEREALHSALHG